MDEAGGYANTQLFWLVDAVFILLPAPDPPLRTLTLGVLIISGGTLAALPFRRYQAIPDASSAPAQVTGPMQSVLESPVDSDGGSRLTHAMSAAGLAAHEYVPTRSAYDADEHRRNVVQYRPRRADIPLSYDDLEIPIDQPDPFKQRFNAIASIRQETRTAEIDAGLVMPPMETLAATQIDQIAKAADQYDDATEVLSKVKGSLASTRHEIETVLPEVTDPSSDPSRARHWIRQPD